MAERSNTPHWETLKISLGSQKQAEEWNSFCIHSLEMMYIPKGGAPQWIKDMITTFSISIHPDSHLEPKDM